MDRDTCSRPSLIRIMHSERCVHLALPGGNSGIKQPLRALCWRERGGSPAAAEHNCSGRCGVGRPILDASHQTAEPRAHAAGATAIAAAAIAAAFTARVPGCPGAALARHC